MKKIEEYIEKIYKNFDEEDEETKILKEETKVHLFEEVEELKQQGLTMEESINKAISNFGSEKIVISEMNLILKRQNKFSKLLTKLALFIFIIACIMQSIDIGYDFIHRYEDPLEDKTTSTYITNTITKKIENIDFINENLENEITQLLDEFNVQSENGLYYLKIENTKDPGAEYEYKKDVTKDTIVNASSSMNGIEKWNIDFKRTDKQAYYDRNRHQELWDNMVDRIPNKLGNISNYLFVVSAVLLSVYFLNKFYLKNTCLSR